MEFIKTGGLFLGMLGGCLLGGGGILVLAFALGGNNMSKLSLAQWGQVFLLAGICSAVLLGGIACGKELEKR